MNYQLKYYSSAMVLAFCIAIAVPVMADDNIYKALSAEPIISFYQSHGMVEGSSFHREVEVYGDGRVVVTLPSYLEGAGTWQYQITPKKLSSIVSLLDHFGLMTFDTAGVLAQKQAIQRSSDTRYEVSDPSVTTFVLNFAHYGIEGHEDVPLKKTVEWKDIAVEAKRYPQLNELTQLVSAEKLMVLLSNHQNRNSVRAVGQSGKGDQQ